MPVGIFDPVRVSSRRSSPVDSQTKKGMVNLMKKTLSLCIASAVVLVGPAVVPEAAAQGLAPDYYGTASTNFYFVSADDFQVSLPDSYDWVESGWGSRYIDGSPTRGMVSANVRLPTGALMTGMLIVYEDRAAGGDLEVRLIKEWWSIGSRGSDQIAPFFNSSGAPGVTRSFVDIDPDHTVRYWASPISVQGYRLIALLDPGDAIQLRGVIIYWKRQVSPAPATATFGDVGTGHWAFRFIEALADSGITAGCGGGNYCPDNPITRGEMAVFLAAALGLHYAP